MSFAKVVRIGRDVEVRYTPGGMAVANIAAAYNYGRKNEDGKYFSQWVEYALWGKQAESLAQYLLKGNMVFVVAKDVHIETFQKQDGTVSTKLVATVVDIDLLPNKGKEAPAPVQRPKAAQSNDNYGDFDGDIPF